MKNLDTEDSNRSAMKDDSPPKIALTGPQLEKKKSWLGEKHNKYLITHLITITHLSQSHIYHKYTQYIHEEREFFLKLTTEQTSPWSFYK